MLFFWQERPVPCQLKGRSAGLGGLLQNGLVSSHFFLRFLHVVHPVFDLALVCFEEVVGDRGGYIRGLPRPRLTRGGSVGDMGGSSAIGSLLTSANESSRSSSLGTISSDPLRESAHDSVCVSESVSVLESKVGVFIGESLLDDIEGCGEEEMLRRACALGGGWPKVRIEVIRPNA
jgi:hypothetical protein